MQFAVPVHGIAHTMAQVISVNISVDESSDLDRTVRDLEGAGLTVDRVLPGVRIVTGTADRNAIPTMFEINGVAHLDREQKVRVGGPFSSFTRRIRSGRS